MDLTLDGNGPLYLQLARALRSAIAGGRLSDGTRVPSSRDLARDLGLSRTTVVSAYEYLRAEGFLRGRVGDGSYVHAPTASVRTTALPQRVPPPSVYARRARQALDVDDLPGRRLPGVRHAFQYGLPLVNPALTTIWSRELARVAPYVRPNYPSPRGLKALREAIHRHIRHTRGVICDPADVIIVNGAQQALSLIARVLLDPGDEVVLEEPHYFGARRILQVHGANLAGVEVDDEGLRVDLLPQRPPKLVVVTPSHQFPTGVTLSHPRRRALLAYAHADETWICEDDYDGEFRCEQAPIPALKSMDADGRVLYVGSFSKTLFPSIRLGYIVAPPALRDDLVNAKWADDFGCAMFEQAALASLMQSGAYDRHLRMATRELAERRHLLRSLLMELCGDRLVLGPSRSGMHLFARLRGMTCEEGEALVQAAARNGIGLYPAAPCYLNPPADAALIMGFSALSPLEIRAAVAAFASELAAFRPESGRAGRPPLYLARSRV